MTQSKLNYTVVKYLKIVERNVMNVQSNTESFTVYNGRFPSFQKTLHIITSYLRTVTESIMDITLTPANCFIVLGCICSICLHVQQKRQISVLEDGKWAGFHGF